MKRISKVLPVVVIALAATVAYGANSFTDLGTGKALDVSKNGTLVTGNGAGGGYIWTPGGGKVTIGNSAEGVDWYAGGVLVAGNSGATAAVWQGTAGGVGAWAALPASDKGAWIAEGLGVKSDGSDWWVAGRTPQVDSNHSAVGYQASTNTAASVTPPPSGHDRSWFYGASDTGVFAGWGQYSGSGATGGARTGWRYGPGAAKAWLPPAAGLSSSNEGQTFAISGNGDVKVGWGYGSPNPNNWIATWWDAADVAHQIPQKPGQDWAEAWSANADGTLIGGYTYLSETNYNDHKAWVYSTTTNAVEWVSDLLAAKGLGVAGWQFTNVTGISDNGNVLVGTGIFGGAEHGWVAMIPEPASLLLLACGMLAVSRSRRR